MSDNSMEVCTPIGQRVVIARDDNTKKTSQGIILPDATADSIITITGRIVAISEQLKADFSIEFPFKEYDKVIYYPNHSVPVDMKKEYENTNKLYVVPAEDVVAILSKEEVQNE